MDPPPRLSCQQCKQRKIRCDKGAPCSACTNAGLNCHTVQRARLPRGKSAKARSQSKMLETRLARIESLLEQQVKAQIPSSHGTEHRILVPVMGKKISDFVAPDFWSSLSAEVHGLRETLEGSEDEDEEEASVPKLIADQATKMYSTGAILFQHSRNSRNYSLPSPSLKVRERLLQLYRGRVESVYKILHWPTVLSTLESNYADLEQVSPSPSVQALAYAIYFMALCSITNSEAEEMGLGIRPDMLLLYRSAVEDLLTGSRLLHNPDLVILQAFVIYLIGLRTHLSGGTTWMLIAIAVRAATALRLGKETPGEFSPFDLQLRRRLFFAIGILDTHSALDRGTVPILPSTAFQTPPLNINDEDMLPPNDVPTVSSISASTDMSHNAMIYDAMICQRKLVELSESAGDGWEHWFKKLELVAAFEKAVQTKHCITSDPATPIERFRQMSGKKIVVSMQLLLRRPPYRQPQNIVPPWDDYNILEAATEVLESHSQATPADLAPWAWKNWVQWHALAVVLAELMVNPQGLSSDRAYAIATKSFHHYARIIADSESGMLWKPIAKLMRRVQRLRTQGVPFDSTTLPGDPSNLSEQLDPIFSGDLNTFDFNNWGIDTETSNMFLDPGSQTEYRSNETQSDNGTPWLAWDSFLHDVNFSAT